jgi:threonine/homoserine/homoserine lactone efflux protein
MSGILEHLLMFSKGLLAGFVYNFAGITSSLFVTDLVIKQGRSSGIIASIGLSMTHIFWAIVSAYALSFAYLKIDENIHVYTFIGSLILFYFAFHIYFKKGKKKTFPFFNKTTKSEKIYLEATIFGLASPEKIVGYAALFAVLNIPKTKPLIIEKIPLIIGVGIGSVIWWAIYIFCFNKQVQSISPKTALLLQKISAYSLAFLGIAGVLNSLVQWRY